MLNRVKKHILHNEISFFFLIFVSLFFLFVSNYVMAQGATHGECRMPYSDTYGLSRISMLYPSQFSNSGRDTSSQVSAWFASFAYQYGQGSAFLDAKPSYGSLDLAMQNKKDVVNQLHPDNVPVNIPTYVTLPSMPEQQAQQYEYLYTSVNGDMWVSYSVLFLNQRGNTVYEYNFLAPYSSFSGFLDDISCMTDSLQVQLLVR
jgi:hypothetical protein